MRGWEEVDRAARDAAALLADRLGATETGVVLGSGFGPLADRLGLDARVEAREIPGCPPSRAPGHGGGVAAGRIGPTGVWAFVGRWHLYEGLGAAEVAFPVLVLAHAGARRVLLTCAAGGLEEGDRPGTFAVVTDHLNLTGVDPLGAVPWGPRQPPFLDLQGAYDARFRESWRRAAAAAGVATRDGVLAAVTGPCYETPAEVRMLRALGADLASMSTVPEVVVGRRLGLAMAALACVANRGAGLGGGAAIEHERATDVVRRAALGAADVFADSLISWASR